MGRKVLRYVTTQICFLSSRYHLSRLEVVRGGGEEEKHARERMRDGKSRRVLFIFSSSEHATHSSANGSDSERPSLRLCILCCAVASLFFSSRLQAALKAKQTSDSTLSPSLFLFLVRVSSSDPKLTAKPTASPEPQQPYLQSPSSHSLLRDPSSSNPPHRDPSSPAPSSQRSR